MKAIVLDHQNVVEDILGSLGALDPDTLCSVYEVVCKAEIVYIGNDEFEILDSDDDSENDSYTWDDYDWNE